jgi:hypothetical protein
MPSPNIKHTLMSESGFGQGFPNSLVLSTRQCGQFRVSVARWKLSIDI